MALGVLNRTGVLTVTLGVNCIIPVHTLKFGFGFGSSRGEAE